MNKLDVFTIKDDEGKDVELALLKPDANVGQVAQMEYNKVFSNGLKSGALLRQELNSYL